MTGVESKCRPAEDDSALVVLVVEDEVLVRMIACDILTEGGYHPIEAVNADEALVLIDARPDIAVMFTDVDMPGEINGLGLVRLVAMKRPALPLIVTTGAAEIAPGDLPPGTAFLAKPYAPSALLTLIEQKATRPADDPDTDPRRAG
jgi:DNA-binding NtrC family response regulator